MNEMLEMALIAMVGPFMGWAVFYIGLLSLGDRGFPLVLAIFMIVIGPVAIFTATAASVGSYPLLLLGSFVFGMLPGLVHAVKAYMAAWQSC